MATKMESGTNSPESEYYSLPGDSDGEEEPTTTIKRKPLDIEREPVIEPGILGTIVARLDSSEEILSTVRPDVRILLCLNAARVMLGQVCLGDSPTNILNRFKGQRLLNLILAICAEWEGADLDMPELLALPLFGAAMEEVEHERLPCSLDAFQALVEEIAERPSAAVISGDNDTIAVLSLCDQLTDGFIVFNPRCRQSPDMTGMSFRLFMDQISTAKHIQNLISVYKGITQTHSYKFSASSFSSSGSSGPMTSPPIHNMYTAWTFVPTQYINVGGHLSKFPGSSDDGQVLHGSQRTIFEANLDLLKHKVELSSTNFEEEVYEMNVHSAASVEKRKREQRGTERQERYREEPTRQSRKGTEKPEERRNVSFEFQTQLADDEASRLLAMAIAEEEENRLLEFQRLQEAYKTFDCPICGDTFDHGDAAQAERCEHVVCRGCMLGHIKAQIEEAHWPIFCGMCTSDLANRGVVTRRVAEVVGANEDLIVGWNRMELGGVSVILECPRCRESTRVDSEDFRAAELLDCPLGCGAHWCKDCHQEVEKGQKHSCDGQAEMDNLAQAQGWKQCPGCSTYCMKNGGCNQLSCKTPGCNMHFCYACGGKIAQTASVNEMIAAKTAHYATCKLW
ncbi:hypothetical protein FRC18_008305 [Serendipita sp. 400]|nr:hypothetical protein FRC18_008305 [Serendipita sp. 400]